MSQIKKLRVTVEGKIYNVEVEMVDEAASGGASASPAAAAPAPAVAPSPAPAPSPAASAAPKAPSGGGGAGDVTSPLSGKIISLHTEVGKEVNEGDQIITVEAMKMNTFVLASKSGKVTEILVQVGDAVDEGQLLAKIQ